MLAALTPGDLLQLQAQTRQLFAKAAETLKTGRGVADIHALEVRRFLGVVRLRVCCCC